MLKKIISVTSALFLYPNLFVGLILFKIKYPSVKWIRPIKLGTYFSQKGQDLFLSTLLFGIIERNPDEEFWIVDVGCNDPIYFNNTLFFEKYFGCRVLAIDPIEEFGVKWKAIRPNSLFYCTALGDSKGTVFLNLDESTEKGSMFSYISTDQEVDNISGLKQREVKIDKLSSIFNGLDIKKILFVSIDVEGFEMNVIRGINFNEVNILCFLIENNTTSLYGADSIRKYLINQNYIFYARIGHLDDVFIHKSLIASTV